MNNHPHKTSWTEGRTAELLRLNAKGLSASQIALKLGNVTRNAVIGKLDRMGANLGGAKASAPKRYAPPPVKAGPRNPVGNFRSSPPRPPVERDEPPGACTLTTLVEHSCRWPIGSGEAMTYCGEKRAGQHSYCTKHRAISVQPFTGRGASAFAPDLAHALRRFV